MCWEFVQDLEMGFGLDDWIYWHLIHSTQDYRQLQRYCWSTHFTAYHYTHTTVLSLHYSYPGNRFITVSLSLQITHEVFFSQPNYPLAIILQLSIQKARLNSIPLLRSSYPGRLVSRNSTQFSSIELFFTTTLHRPRRKHSLPLVGKACLQRHCIEMVVTQLLLVYSLPQEFVYWVVA
jgi:hypothetical protein